MFDGCNCSSFTGFKPETRTGLHVVDLCVYIQWVIREWSKEMRWRKVDVKKGQRFVPHQNLQLSCSWRLLSMMSHAYVIAVQGPNRKKWCQNIINFKPFHVLYATIPSVCISIFTSFLSCSCLKFFLPIMPVLSRYDDQTDGLRPPTASTWRYDESSEDDGASSSSHETLGWFISTCWKTCHKHLSSFSWKNLGLRIQNLHLNLQSIGDVT